MRTDAAEIFQLLARSGIDFEKRWRASLRRLQAGQDNKGRWALSEPAPVSLGITGGDEVGLSSPWVTLRAATALMRYAVEARLPRMFPFKPVENR